MEAEKRIRREIANSNERRRMQSINAGFQSLRTLLPRHEGEKLSKAAILQQTAEYIYALEQEKTRLLSQNCQLKRLLNQHEGGDIPTKKRKNEIVADCAQLSELSDEHASSPEPVTIISVVDTTSTADPEMSELRHQLDRERRMRMGLEERMRTFESQMYSDNLSHQITLQYNNTEVIEQTDDLQDMVSVAIVDTVETEDDSQDKDVMREMQMMTVEVPSVAEHRTVTSITTEVVPVNMAIEDEPLRMETESPSPVHQLSILDNSIKAEPKVEVEVLPGIDGAVCDPSRLYLASTSRQNLETIVEAIRHLEGDHLFAEEQQELPLALTNKPGERRMFTVEMNDLLQYRPQTRPGVIVGKPS